MHHARINVILSLILPMQSVIGFCFVLCFLLLDMTSKPSGKFKTRAKRTLGSSSSSDSARFLTEKCEETYETLNKYRSI